MESELAVLQEKDYHRLIKRYSLLLERHTAIQKRVHEDEHLLRELAFTCGAKKSTERRVVNSGIFGVQTFRFSSPLKKLSEVRPAGTGRH